MNAKWKDLDWIDKAFNVALVVGAASIAAILVHAALHAWGAA